MKQIMTFFVLAAIATTLAASDASTVVRPFSFDFGYDHMWARDDDGDGIPNGQDPHWFSPLDGTGYQMRHGATFNSTPRSDGKEWKGDIIRNRYRKRTGECDQNGYRYRYR